MQAGAIVCPMDRQITDVGGGGVWDLKKNFALIELMEKLQLGTVNCSNASKSLPANAISCSSSSTNVSITAYFCMSNFLCLHFSKRDRRMFW